MAVGDAMMLEREVLSLHQTSISHTIHHNDRALLLKEDGLMLDEEGKAEEALAALADLAASGGGNQDGGEVEDGEEEEEDDDMLIPEDLLQEDDNEGQKEEEEEQEEYTGPVVVEYEHDVAMPSLMTGEQFEAAMEAQFLQPHRVSTQARKALTRKRTRKGVDANADNDALVLFALLRPHPTRWYVWGRSRICRCVLGKAAFIRLTILPFPFYTGRWCLEAAQANFFLTEQGLCVSIYVTLSLSCRRP